MNANLAIRNDLYFQMMKIFSGFSSVPEFYIYDFNTKIFDAKQSNNRFTCFALFGLDSTIYICSRYDEKTFHIYDLNNSKYQYKMHFNLLQQLDYRYSMQIDSNKVIKNS